MTQAERDRLVALKKAKKKLITQKQAAEELGITERHVRRLLRALKRRTTAHSVGYIKKGTSTRQLPDPTYARCDLSLIIEELPCCFSRPER